jgi:hypothetical protein
MTIEKRVRPRPGTCIVCGATPHRPVVIGRYERAACPTHAAIAERVRPKTIAAFVDACTTGERTPGERRGDRRGAVDRRAFWRPTADRRREATERGRRATDGEPG